MIRSKRLLAVGLVAVLGLAAAACGDDDDDGGGADTTADREGTTAAGTTPRRPRPPKHPARPPRARRAEARPPARAPRLRRHDGARGHGRLRPSRTRRRPAVRRHRPWRQVVQRRRRRRARPGRLRFRRHRHRVDPDERRRPRRAHRRAGRAEGNDLVIGVGFLWQPATAGRGRGEPRPAVRRSIDAVADRRPGTPDDFADDGPLHERRLDDGSPRSRARSSSARPPR